MPQLRCKRGSKRGALERLTEDGSHWYTANRRDARHLPQYNKWLSKRACKRKYSYDKDTSSLRPYWGADEGSGQVRWYRDVDVNVTGWPWAYPSYAWPSKWNRSLLQYGAYPSAWIDDANSLLLRATPPASAPAPVPAAAPVSVPAVAPVPPAAPPLIASF